MNRRDIFKVLPIAALVPTFAHSKEELEKKLDDTKAKYLILVNPAKFDLKLLTTNYEGLKIYAEIWPILDIDPSIQIFKLE
jgi:hypothetical protein